MSEKEPNLGLILEGCLKGNRNSQARLYRYYFGYGMSIALPYAKAREEAVEILNDAFLKVFTRLHQFNPNYNFKYWFRKIIVHTAIDYHRKYKRNLELVDLDIVDELEEAETSEILHFKEDIDVLPILQKLSPVYRVVLNLYVLEGYKHQEIAEQLNISVSASRSNLTRAKQQLKKLLESAEGLIQKTRG